MQSDRVHPRVRELAVRVGADEITAIERDDQVQHKLTWYAEHGNYAKVKKYALETDTTSMGDVKIKVDDDGVATITAPVFIDKGATARRFEKIQEITPDGHPHGWNWRPADDRQSA